MQSVIVQAGNFSKVLCCERKVDYRDLLAKAVDCV